MPQNRSSRGSIRNCDEYESGQEAGRRYAVSVMTIFPCEMYKFQLAYCALEGVLDPSHKNTIGAAFCKFSANLKFDNNVTQTSSLESNLEAKFIIPHDRHIMMEAIVPLTELGVFAEMFATVNHVFSRTTIDEHVESLLVKTESQHANKTLLFALVNCMDVEGEILKAECIVMEAIVALTELGVSFVPVPGLQPAAQLFKLIWDNVQKASNNRESLKNLAKSSAEIFATASNVLSRTAIDEHVESLLVKLNQFLSDFLEFTEQHANKNLFFALVNRVDVEGEIQAFQHRMQNIMMAFQIAAFSALEETNKKIQTQLEKLIQGQGQQNEHPDPRLGQSGDNYGNTAQQRHPNIQTIAEKPVRTSVVEKYKYISVGASFDKPSKIMFVNHEATIAVCGGESPFNFSCWGLRESGSIVVDRDGGFDIDHGDGSKTSRWRLLGKRLSLTAHDSAHSDWDDSIDIIFHAFDSARSWFSFLKTLASTNSKSSVYPQPPQQEVLVRRKFNVLMQKTSHCIIRCQPNISKPSKEWLIVCWGLSQNAREYPTHLVYVGLGLPAFATIYRSGNTLVRETYRRANDEEPVTTSRVHFRTDTEAATWYHEWKRIMLDNRSPDMPFGVVSLDSEIWLSVNLSEWGIMDPKATVVRQADSFKATTSTTSWSWRLIGNRITIYASIMSQPDCWGQTVGITYDRYHFIATHVSLVLASPRNASVTVKRDGICWICGVDGSVMIRAAMAEQWGPLFRPLTRMEDRGTRVVLRSSRESALPVIQLSREEKSLILVRNSSERDTGRSVMRKYIFDSDEEAAQWYQQCKMNANRLVMRKNGRGK
ncbi:hypothetical protein BU17DRAFT_65584 [Hysterangium stoloniferum]|nr:hypothetical protein BU17DRAFT_65584 [Hysterangium stoloniferum]